MSRFVSVVLGLFVVGVMFSGCSGGGGGSDGVISFTAASFSQNEDGTLTGLEMTLQRVGGSGEVSATVQFTDGTATGGVDYDPTPIVVTWLAGDLSDKTIAVAVVDDNIDEQPGETVFATITSTGGGADIGAQNTATLTILDDDEAGDLLFDALFYSFNEDGTAVTVEVTVLRVGGLDGQVTALITSSDGGGGGNPANSNPNSLFEPLDYNAIGAGIVFNDGDNTPQQFLVGTFIIDDALPELDETFTLSLTNLTGGATLGGIPSTVITIVNNDSLLRITKPAFAEGGHFGSSIIKHGRHLLIGAPGSASPSGLAFLVDPAFGEGVQTFDGGAFNQEFGTAITRFGSKVAISGNGFVQTYDVDPFTLALSQSYDLHSPKQGFGSALLGTDDGRFLVGAPLAQLGGSTNPSGSVNVYSALTGALIQEIDGTGIDEFGTALLKIGGDVAIGVPGGLGSVHGFFGTPLTFGALIANPEPQDPSAGFGRSLLSNGGDILIGAPTLDYDETADGQVFVLSGGTTFAPLDPIVGGLGNNVNFGSALFLLEETNRVAVFSPGEGTNGCGRLVTYAASNYGFVNQYECPDPTPNARFGHAAVEFDGAYVVGAPLADLVAVLTDGPLLVDVGCVYIFLP